MYRKLLNCGVGIAVLVAFLFVATSDAEARGCRGGRIFHRHNSCNSGCGSYVSSGCNSGGCGVQAPYTRHYPYQQGYQGYYQPQDSYYQQQPQISAYQPRQQPVQPGSVWIADEQGVLRLAPASMQELGKKKIQPSNEE